MKYVLQTILSTTNLLSQAIKELEAIQKTLTIRFHSLPRSKEFLHLLVWVDIFTNWVKAFPYKTEKAQKVIKTLLYKIIPRFGLPKTLQIW